MIKKILRGAAGLLGLSLLIMGGFLVFDAQPAYAADGDDYFWVQGTGNWSDYSNHWATTSGGAVFHGAAPNATNDVFFDANSDAGGAWTVTIDAVANCRAMDWTGAENSPVLAFGTNSIQYSGNLVFIAGMSTTATTGSLNGITNATSTVTTNGLNIAPRLIKSLGDGVIQLADNFTGTNTASNAVAFVRGTIDTNGKTVTLAGGVSISGTIAVTVTLGASNLTCSAWNMASTSQTLTANTATINCAGNFSGGGLATYNIVNLTGATSTITGSNTFNTLGLTRAGVQTITFTDGTTQTVTNFTRNVGAQVKTLQGSGVAGWAITKAGGGTSYNDYLSISRSTASPAATFIAGANSTNGGNNVNWTFVADVVTNDESNINTHETTLNGTITTNGSNATRRGFQFGTVSGALTGDWYEDGSFGDGAYSVQLTGLAGDTTYYYRAYSVTGGITEYGAELSFTTRDAAWLLVRFILPIVVAFGLILGVIGAWGGNGKISMIGIAIGLAGFIMIQAIISTI